MPRFLHAADVHLDSPLLNLQRYDGAPVEVFRNATRGAFDNLIELAIQEAVAFLVIAGDLYDGDCSDSGTPLYFRRQMERLHEHGIGVYIIQGNHDAGVHRQFRMKLPPNVTLFSTKRAETVRIDDLRVALHGQGFGDRAVPEDLSANYPEAVPDWLNIGILHTSCGTHLAHDTYAPSSIEGLTRKNYQYWALGHIHQQQILAQPAPWIVYSGNTQGRNIRETGAKGCYLVTFDGAEIVDVAPRTLDVVRWADCTIDVSLCDDRDAARATVLAALNAPLADADGRPLAVRLTLQGATACHRALRRYAEHWTDAVRQDVVDHFNEQIWLEKVRIKTTPLDGDTTPTTADAARVPAELIESIRATSSFDDLYAELRPDITALLTRLPSDPRLADEQIDPDDPAFVQDVTDEARELLIGRLMHAEDPA